MLSRLRYWCRALVRASALEIGMEATPGSSVALFYAGGVRLGVIGLVLGLPVSLVANYLLNSQASGPTSPETTPSIALVGGMAAAVALVVASVATLIPAPRAARVDPVTALRSE
ncbi:MAG: hypothetical protein ABJF01_24200 [bacterium]